MRFVLLIALLPALNCNAQAVEDGSLDCLIEPLMVVQIGSRADGVLEEVLVDRGDDVSRGQLLAALDSLPERAALELARQRASEDVGVRSSQVKLAFGQRRADRYAGVHLADAVTELEKDEMVTAAWLARLQVDEAHANRLIASLEMARVEALLQQRRIVSPLNGVVVERLMNPGERVTDTPILTLAQIDPLKVEVIVPVALLGSVRVGATATVHPEAPMGGEYLATVTVVDRVIDARSGTFGVRLELPNPDHALPGGLRCRVRFGPSQSTPQTALAPLPTEADMPAQTAPATPRALPAPPLAPSIDTPTLQSAEAKSTANPVSIPPTDTSPTAPLPQTETTAATALGNLLLPAATASALRETKPRDEGSTRAPVTHQTSPAGTDSAGLATESSSEADDRALEAERIEQMMLAALPPLPVLPPLPLEAIPQRAVNPPADGRVDAGNVPPEKAPQAAPSSAPDTTAELTTATIPEAATTPEQASVVSHSEDSDSNMNPRASTVRPVTPDERDDSLIAMATPSPERSVSASAQAPERGERPRATGQNCSLLGPFDDNEDARRIADRARDAGWTASVESRDDRPTGMRLLTVALLDDSIDGTGAALAANGFDDVHYLASGPYEGAWSAGVFGNLAFAEERRAALANAGFAPSLQLLGGARARHWVRVDGDADRDDWLEHLAQMAPIGVTPCQ